MLRSLAKRTRNNEIPLDHRTQDELPPSGYLQTLNRHVSYFGGYTLVGFMLARLIGGASLLILSTKTLRNTCDIISFTACPETFLTSTFVSDSRNVEHR